MICEGSTGVVRIGTSLLRTERDMRLRIALGTLWMLLLAAHATAVPPQRVMSINLCSDQLLLNLLPPERITSVTYLSREPYESYLSAAAWQVGVNYGLAEEVVRDHPDLVLAGLYTTPDTRHLLKSVGMAVMELPPANNFAEIREQTRQVAHAVGADEQAERLIRRMDATLAQLAATAPKQPITVVGWEGGGAVPGRGTLNDAIFTAAGAVNIGAAPGLRSVRFDAEQLLMSHPDLLAFGDATIATPALRNAPLALPVVRRLYAGRQIVYPELLYDCGLPQSADAAVQIRRVMLAALRSEPRK
jgi:iron complex transport system substrate-binding protein